MVGEDGLFAVAQNRQTGLRVHLCHGLDLTWYCVTAIQCSQRADPLVGALHISTQGHAWLGTS